MARSKLTGRIDGVTVTVTGNDPDVVAAQWQQAVGRKPQRKRGRR
jgi:hypothetical protein